MEQRYEPSVLELTDGYRRPSLRPPPRYQEDLDDEELRCGFLSCTPGCLQWLHTSRWLLAVLSFCSFVQSFVVNSIFPVGISTLERRFNMNSSQTGIISSWYDLANLLAVFPVCHWGNSGHKGRWIAVGCVLMGLGSLVCALPHFTVAPYQVSGNAGNESDFGQCTRRGEHECKKDQKPRDLSNYFYVFLIGQTLHGLGSTPLFSIGTTYIDENVSQKASPVYLAIYAVVASLGPAVGLILGGTLLSIYTDFNRGIDWRTETNLQGPNDARWIGAWWIGFLASGALAIVATVPMAAFARELPEAKKHRLKDIDQVHAVSYIDEDDEMLGGDLKHMPKAIWNILRNPTFVACMVVGIFESIVINGFAAFMPKILETILSTTPTIASYMSSVVILAAAVGVITGGILIRKMNLQVGGMLKLMAVCHFVALITLSTFLVQCPPRSFVGINVDYNNKKVIDTSVSSLLDADCNSNCDCSNEWNPVCHVETSTSYYSACHAGCTVRQRFNNSDIQWTGCTCLKNLLHNRTLSAEDAKINSGYCTKSCGIMWIFLAFVFCSVVASFASGIPTQQIMLRVVPFKQRTLGIGVNWTILRLFGFIPGGVLFGLMIDTTCIKWNDTCGKRGSCLVYDPGLLSWTLFGVAAICKVGSIVASIVGYMLYRPNDQDNELSVQTADSRGPLQLTVNDDRAVTITNNLNKMPVKQ